MAGVLSFRCVAKTSSLIWVLSRCPELKPLPGKVGEPVDSADCRFFVLVRRETSACARLPFLVLSALMESSSEVASLSDSEEV